MPRTALLLLAAAGALISACSDRSQHEAHAAAVEARFADAARDADRSIAHAADTADRSIDRTARRADDAAHHQADSGHWADHFTN